MKLGPAVYNDEKYKNQFTIILKLTSVRTFEVNQFTQRRIVTISLQ